MHSVVFASGVVSRMRISDDQYTPFLRAGEAPFAEQSALLALLSLLLFRVAEFQPGRRTLQVDALSLHSRAGGAAQPQACPIALRMSHLPLTSVAATGAPTASCPSGQVRHRLGRPSKI